MTAPEIQRYQFGPYRIDTEERLLRCNGELVALPAQAANTLLVLLSHAGRVAEKGDLMKAVGLVAFVDEPEFDRNISLLRKKLGDVGDEPVYIEAMAKGGYRFVAPVRMVAGDPGVQRGTTRLQASASPAIKWVALAAMLLLLGLALAAYLIGARSVQSAGSGRTSATAPAVVPLCSFKSDPAQAYFADGITQALFAEPAIRLPVRNHAYDTGGAA